MKRLLSLLLPLLSNVMLSAQEIYTPMIVSGNQWNEHAQRASPLGMIHRTYITTVGKDTIVDGQTYKKILTAKDSLSNNWEETGCIREDVVNQKVYYRPENQPEILLYDFHVQVGDTLYSYELFSGWDVKIEIKSIDYVLIDGGLRKKISILSVHSEEYDGDIYYFTGHHVWIEGIGCVDGFLQSTQAGKLDGGYGLSLLCFYQNEELIYKLDDTGFDDCFIWHIPTKIENKVVELPYNIQQKGNLLSVSSKMKLKFDIEMIDTTGKLLFQNASNENTIDMDISCISAGVYIIKILSNNKVYNSKIIIKK
jgi:hypothetical protein